MLDLDQLIPADHLARAIDHLGEAAAWCEIPGGQQKRRGLRGAAWADPQMLVAMWVCAYSRGMGEAEATAKELKYEPALRWLAGNGTLSARTLSGFRVAHKPALRGLFAELLRNGTRGC